MFNSTRNILENGFVVPKRIIMKELDKNKRTLDVGCGTGEHSILFNPKQYYGIDISKKYINSAKKKFKGNFFVMNAQHLKFPDKSFDSILIFGVIHHLSDKVCDNMLKEVKRVSKNKAKILVIEDIPTKSKFNIIGRVMQYFDSGSKIRKTRSYRKILSKHFQIKKEFEIISGVADYCVFILEK